MDKLLISVIIPIYNVEKYIEKCINSIIVQTYTNMEVILVDDGSPDNCPQICDEYAKKDKRIKVIHKKNGGLSDARNVGVKNAIGDYIIFLDSDDYWENKTHMEIIAKQLQEEKADVLIFGYRKFYEDTKKYSKPIFSCNRDALLKSKKQLRHLIKHKCYESSSWNKVIKKTLFDDNDLDFRKGVISEDIEWSAKLAIYAETFDYLNESVLAYVQRSGSITKNITIKNINDIFLNIKYSLRLIEENKISDEKKDCIMQYLAFQYSTLLIHIGKCNIDINNQTLDEIKKYKYLLKYSMDKRIILTDKFMQIFGLRATIKILYLYHKISNTIKSKI